MKLRSRLSMMKWNIIHSREWAIRKAVWMLPRSIVYWAFIRLSTFNYGGNPAERTCGDVLKANRDWFEHP